MRRYALSRRQVVTALPWVAAALAGCNGPIGASATVQEAEVQATVRRWHMPLESALHLRTFMQWPANLEVYDRRSLARTQAAVAVIANAVADFEPVVMLAAAAHHRAARRLLSDRVELWDVPTDDLWCRDSGPTFVTGSDGQQAIMHIAFNGWGNKQPHAHDALVTPRLAERLGLPLINSGLIGEQGGIEHDGTGTLLAHASCWVNPNRNAAGADAIGERLMAALGGQKMIWAPGIIGADITDYHIDALARFVGPGHVLIQIGDDVDADDPWSVAAHETLSILRGASDAHGRPLTITTLPEPRQIRSRAADFVSSYVNYYVCNGAIIMAQFGDAAADAEAQSIIAGLYPGRAIVALNIDPIGAAGGGIHCATQQQPGVTA